MIAIMMRRLALVVLGLIAISFGTGCGNACDELADEAEACCEEEADQIARELCLSFVEAIRENGDSDACQEALDEGYECTPSGTQQ